MTKNQNITIYSADPPNRFIFSYLIDIINDLPRAHELGIRLFKRNLKALYRQSILGITWALLPPLATAFLWIFLHDSNVVNINTAGMSYPVFVLTGTILWQVFSEAITTPLNQVSENRAMLSKINIPREGLLLSGIYQLIFNTVIKLILLIVVFIFFRQTTSLLGWMFASIGLFIISLAGFSIGLILTPIGMLYQDVNRGLVMLLPFFMYLTPIVYSVPSNSKADLVMKFNPLATLITQTRNWLTAQPVYDLQYFWIFSILFVWLFLISIIVYRLSMPMVIERIGS